MYQVMKGMLSMASGNFLAIFTALSNVPPVSAFATFDTRNNHPVLDFDDTTDEEAIFLGVVPANYAGGGLTIDIYCSFTSATSNVCRWEAMIERMDVSSLDTDADSFASSQSAAVTAPGTSGQIVKATITMTSGAQMDSLAAGESYRLKIRRDANATNGTDSVTGDAELHRVVIKQT